MIGKIIENFIYFDRRWCFFAINNACNNKCEMCSIWKDEPKFVRFEDAKRVLDKLHENNFNVIQLTGGEPLINPDFFKIVEYAKKLNFIVFAPTNGTLINEEIAEKLKKSRIDQISISLHHHEPAIFEKITSHKNILKKVVRSIKLLKKKKIPVSLLCTISKSNINDIEKIIKFVDKFNVVTSFCMPVMVKNTSFRLGGNIDSVSLSKEELNDALSRIIKLKQRGYNILNSLDYIIDTKKYLNKENKYNCFGGSKLFYIDWNLNVYPCMCKGKPINIDKYDFSKNNSEECNECIIQCFREPSMIISKRTDFLKIFIKNIPFLFIMLTKDIKSRL